MREKKKSLLISALICILLLFIGVFVLLRHFRSHSEVVYNFDLDMSTVAGYSETLRVAVDVNCPPYSFVDEKGRPSGYGIELIYALGRELGCGIDLVLTGRQNAMLGVRKGEYDIFLPVNYATSWASRGLTLSEPLLSDSYILFGRKGEALSTDINALQELTLGAMVESGITASLIEPLSLSDQVSYYSSVSEALQSVVRGENDAVLCSFTSGSAVIGLEQLPLEAKGAALMVTSSHALLNEENTALTARLNAAIEALRQRGELDELADKWTERYTPGLTFGDFVNANRRSMLLASLWSFTALVCLFYIMLFRSSRREQHLLELDSVTRLPNRRYFCRLVERMLKRFPEESFSILLFELEDYNRDKDIIGNAVGEKALATVGKLLREDERNRAGRFIYGVMGDFFLLCCPREGLEPKHFYQWAEDFQRRSFGVSGGTVCMGIADIDGSAETVSEYCDRALMARRSIPADSDTHWVRFENAILSERKAQLELMQSVNDALLRGEFVPWFQPQVDYPTGSIIGAEVLCRWKHPEKGILGPGAFIPAFERSDRIYELDRYVWAQACVQLAEWRSKGLRLPSLSVNISRRDIYHEDLPDYLKGLLEKFGLQPKDLRLEITESGYMENPRQLIGVVDRLCAMGFDVEMDDFGSGYSSLGALKELPVNLIKLDMSLVQEAQEGRRSGSILVALVRMIHQLDLPVIAEGVETVNQAEFLKSVGCNTMQGYFFYKPMSAADFEKLLDSQSDKPKVKKQTFTYGVDNADNFLHADTQEALLFNSFVGGACIAELRDGELEILRTNDRLYEVFGVEQKAWAKVMNSGTLPLYGEIGQRFKAMLRTAIESGKEAECDIMDNHLHPGRELWIRVRARCLAQKLDSYIFYCDFQNISHQHELSKRNDELLNELTLVINNLPCGVARFRFEGERLVCEFVSRLFHEMMGYTKAELMSRLGEDTFSVVYRKDVSRICEALAFSREKQRDFDEHFRLVHKDGHLIHVTVSGTYVSDDRGEFLYACCEDNTNELAARQNLAESRAALNNLISSFPGGTAVYKPVDGTLVLQSITPGAAAISGRTVEEHMRDSRENLDFGIYPGDRESFHSFMNSLCTPGTEGELSFRVYHKNGQLIWVNLHGQSILQENGEIAVYCAYRDQSSITGLYEAVLDGTGTAVLVISEKRHEVLYANRAAADIFGRTGESMMGANCKALWGAEAPCLRGDCAFNTGEERLNGRTFRVRRTAMNWDGDEAVITYLEEIEKEEKN